jgi:hypothetical protein
LPDLRILDKLKNPPSITEDKFPQNLFCGTKDVNLRSATYGGVDAIYQQHFKLSYRSSGIMQPVVHQSQAALHYIVAFESRSNNE